MRGDEALMAKQRFTPCIGTRRSIISRLAQNFQRRRARWGQLALSHAQRYRACGLDFVELYRCSHPTSIIQSAWHTSRGHDPGYAISIRHLARLPRHRKGVMYSRISFSRKLASLEVGLASMYGVHIPVSEADRLDALIVELRSILFPP